MKSCKICKTEFKPASKRAVTCGSDECKHTNKIRTKNKAAVSSIDYDVIMKNRFLTNSWY